MKRILFLCATGITTSLLTKKLNAVVIEKEAEKESPPHLRSAESYEVVACPIEEAANQGKDAVAMMLSPQVRFNFAKIQNMFPDKVVLKIEAEDYMNLNAEKIYDDLIKKLK